MRIIKLNLLALLVLLATNVACAQRGPAYDDEIEVATQPQAETVQVKSAKMGRNIPVVVTVPEQYFDADLQEELFPVVYLLHGADGDCNNWPNKADLDGLALNSSLRRLWPRNWWITSTTTIALSVTRTCVPLPG